MTSQTQVELQRLLSALCDGAIEDAQQARLEELLRSDPECRRVYLQYVDMHARLLMHPQLAANRVLSLEGERGLEVNGHTLPGKRQRRMPQVIKYGLVAAGTLAASLLVQTFLLAPRAPGNDRPTPSTAADKSQPDYVATLAQAVDCKWEKPSEAPRPSARMRPGELRIRNGAARLHFHSGSDLLIEGPAVVRIESSTAATVLAGKVVFQGDETSAPFDLRTPSSTFVDFGTEYAVDVGPKGEEVYVFSGEVQRTPLAPLPRGETRDPEQLTAGEARRYAATPSSEGEPVPFDEAIFKRYIGSREPTLGDPTAQLLAYEGFDYRDSEALRVGKGDGGKGWATAWKGFARPAEGGDAGQPALNVHESLFRPGDRDASAGGCFDFTGFSKYYRKLQTPVRLDTEEVYYLSFLFRRYAASDDPVNTVAVLLRTENELRNENPRRRLNIGVGKGNCLFTFFDRASSKAPLPLNYGETYLLVAKIVAGGPEPSQVFLRVYAPEEPIDPEEPGSWSVVGVPFQTDMVFDFLEVHINSKTRQAIDEVRLGTSWLSVVYPWVRDVRPKKE
jgi:hypothetical protein